MSSPPPKINGTEPHYRQLSPKDIMGSQGSSWSETVSIPTPLIAVGIHPFRRLLGLETGKWQRSTSQIIIIRLILQTLVASTRSYQQTPTTNRSYYTSMIHPQSPHIATSLHRAIQAISTPFYLIRKVLIPVQRTDTNPGTQSLLSLAIDRSFVYLISYHFLPPLFKYVNSERDLFYVDNTRQVRAVLSGNAKRGGMVVEQIGRSSGSCYSQQGGGQQPYI